MPKTRQASTGFSRNRGGRNRTTVDSMPSSPLSDSEADESETWARIDPAMVSKFPHPGTWYDFLIQEGYFWESSRLLRSMLSLPGDANGCYHLDGSFEKVFGLRNLKESVKKFITGDDEGMKDEQHFFANFANAIALIPFLNNQSNHQIQTVQNQVVKMAESMARKLFLHNQELINSRPYFYWLMVKGTLKMMANNQAKPSVLSTSYRSSRDLSQEGIDRQSYSSNTNESINSKPATDPSSWDSILSTIEASAADIGDYGTTSDALVIHINGVSKAETHMKKIQELASLSLSVMNDAVGCAICLVREARLIISHESSNLDQSDQRTDLYLRFKDFDELYPSWFEHPQLQNLPNLVAFDVPLACWEKMCALNQLLLSMNRPAGAQLSLSSQYVVERHLSTKRYPSDLRFLNREPCTGCYYCDKKEKSVRFPQSRRISHTRRIRRVSPSGSQKLANLKQIRTPDRTDGLKQPEKENSWQNSCDVEAELRPDSQEEASGHGKKTKSSPLDKIDSDCRTNSRPRVIVGFTGIPDVPDKSFNVSIALGESFEVSTASLGSYQLLSNIVL